jgi:hypothetical protein
LIGEETLCFFFGQSFQLDQHTAERVVARLLRLMRYGRSKFSIPAS